MVEDFDTGFAMERNEYRASSGRVYAEAGGFTYLFENDYIGSREPVYEALLAPEEDSMALLEAGGPDDACLLAIRKAHPDCDSGKGSRGSPEGESLRGREVQCDSSM